jgi:putative chitinase
MPWLVEICRTAEASGLINDFRKACFVGQLAHESSEFTHLIENLNYSDPERIVRTFRGPFDSDHDKQVDPAEIEIARAYVHEPEKLANFVYANRMGNGDEASGDGYRFRGRGPIQITGRMNYTRCRMAIGVDILTNPDYLLTPAHGLASAYWFWRSNGCNELADLVDHTGITKKINGGTTGLDDRINYFNKVYEEIT